MRPILGAEGHVGFTVVTGNPEACQSGEQLQQSLAVNNAAKEQQVAMQTFVRNTGKVRTRDHPRSERAHTGGPTVL